MIVPITDLISFDTAGLVPQPASPPERRWSTERGLHVQLTVHERLPEFPATAAGEAAVRAMYRDVAVETGSGLVEMTFPRVDGSQTRRMILKRMTDPTTGWGRTFIGMLQIAMAGACVSLRVECSEAGPTGAREAMVTQHLFRSGALKLPEGLPEGGLDRTQASMSLARASTEASKTNSWWKVW